MPAYTDRDLASIRTRFQALIRSVFSDWSEFQVANFGNILKDLYAWSSDIQGFYLNAHASEAFLPSAVQRRSLLRLAQLVGYRPRGRSAASADLTFSATGLTADCVIPAGTVVSTLTQPNPLTFQTLAPARLYAGGPSTATVTVENSTSENEAFAATGQPGFSITLGATPYLGSLSVSTPQGDWTEVRSFTPAAPSDRVFVVSVDDNDRATIKFGDGVTAGAIPTGTVHATFKTGGGAVGNTEANKIKQITTALMDVDGALCQVTCSNAGAATGGADREGVESIRVTAPASVTAPVVSVARRDFEIHACAVEGIDRALYLTNNEDPTIPLNLGRLFLVSPGVNGADYPDDARLAAVRAQFTRDDGSDTPFPMMATQRLEVVPAAFLDVGVVARIYFERNRTAAPQAQYESSIAKGVKDSLVSLFSTMVRNADGSLSTNEGIDFGFNLGDTISTGTLAASDIANAIHDVDGVRELGPNPSDLLLTATRRAAGSEPVVTQAAARHDIVLAASDFPRLGNVVLIDGDTGALIPT